MTDLICLKRPGARLDYGVDWSRELAQHNDTIALSEWSGPDDLTLHDPAYTTTATTVWVSGGQLGQRLEITNRITTAAGRIDERSILIVIGPT
jgi:hypothetical protein